VKNSSSKQTDLLKQQSLKNLSRVLSDLALSPHYEVLRSVPIAQFIGKKLSNNKVLTGITLEDLYGISRAELSPLTALPPLQIKHLIKSLWPLLGATAIEPMGTTKSSPTDSEEKSDAESTISPLELQSKLTALVAQLNTSKKLATLKSKTLAAFWDPSWPKAPFEEALTFQQICSVDIEALTKKRSFTLKKGVAMMHALERALADGSSSGASAALQSFPSSPTDEDHHDTVVRSIHGGGSWEEPSTKVPLHGRNLIELMAREIRRGQALASPSSGARLLMALPQVLTQEEWYLWWLAQDYHANTLVHLVEKKERDIEKSVERIRVKLSLHVEKVAPEVASFWKDTDTTREFPDRYLYDPYLDKQLDREILRIALSLMRAALVHGGPSAA
jgi:hypothetical protein